MALQWQSLGGLCVDGFNFWISGGKVKGQCKHPTPRRRHFRCAPPLVPQYGVSVVASKRTGAAAGVYVAIAETSAVVKDVAAERDAEKGEGGSGRAKEKAAAAKKAAKSGKAASKGTKVRRRPAPSAAHHLRCSRPTLARGIDMCVSFVSVSSGEILVIEGEKFFEGQEAI